VIWLNLTSYQDIILMHQNILQNKRILLIIGGGIAAYKSLQLIRDLSRKGASVRCVLTRAAKEFVTPLTVAGLSGQKVYDQLFSLTDEAEMGHIKLSRDADIVVVAPTTANIMAKMAHGQADDLASTLILATDKPVLIAPSMNVRMWLHVATQRNLEQLHKDGIFSVAPNEGSMACGEYGPGRMAEPSQILSEIERVLSVAAPKALPAQYTALAGKHVLITAGPTHEAIDPVRYIANHSSGKQGYALAQAALNAGAKVTLISGPVAIAAPIGVELIKIESALQMQAAVEAALPADIAIFAAAVADWRVADAGLEKLKKTNAAPQLILTENPDILKTISHRTQNRPQIVVGFAAETQNLIENATAKFKRKGCDILVANDVSASQNVFGGDDNTVHIIDKNGATEWSKMSKQAVASELMAYLAKVLK
jgi:phosphopantothenoylcysteine decarboxylase / phosphopantothenate---cysteine ligase